MRATAGRARPAIALGFGGSVLMAAGSLGAGWLGPASVIRDWPIIQAIRVSTPATTLAIAAVVAGVHVLITAWLRLGVTIEPRGAGADRLHAVVLAAALWALPLMVSLPLFSRDVFAYLGQGRVLAHGLDPYTHPIASVAGWFGIGVDPLWAGTPSPYGPAFVVVESAVVQAVGLDSPEAALLLFRAIAVISVVVIGVYAVLLARERRLDAARVLWWSVASPLALMTLVCSAHNDALMLALILAAVYHARRRPAAAIVLAALAIGIKPIAVIALPVVGLVWAGPGASWRRRAGCWLVSAVLATAVLVITSVLTGTGFGWVPDLVLPASIPSWYSPTGMLAFGAGTLLGLAGADTGTIETIIKSVGVALGAAGVVYAMVTPRRLTPLTRMALAFSLFIVFSPTIYPWYVVWVLVLWAVVGLQERLSRALAAGITVFLCCTSVAEPFDVPVLGVVTGSIRIGTTVVVFAAAIAIMVTFWLAERGERRWLEAPLVQPRGLPHTDERIW